MKQDWPSQLAPYHAPPPAGWWPPAPGWWLLAVLLLALIVGLVLLWRSRTRRLRRAALRELARLEATAVDDAELARGLQQLLRRYALVRFGREQVARLHGEHWIEFVVAHGGRDWAGSPGVALLRAAYGGNAPSERTRWLSGARAFLRARK